MDEEGQLPIERELRYRPDDLGPAPRAELLRVLTMTNEERALRIGKLYANPRSRTMAELLVDLEDDPAARGIVIAELRTMRRQDG
jgi:hypothetical protein